MILAPQAITDPAAVAQQLAALPKSGAKPLIASWMGGGDVAAGEAILNRAAIPAYPYPDSAARVFQLMWRYSANLQALYETPAAFEMEVSDAERARAATLIANTRAQGRTLLTEVESKSLLAAYGIPTVPTEIANGADQAAQAAARIGYPVVLKLHSETITHKTDVGGVWLNLAGEDSVRAAYRGIEESVRKMASDSDFLGVTVQPMVRADGYELILGSSIDSQFGPVILFGSGGQLVEVYKDRAVGLPPLNTTLARRVMERTKILTALKGVRGRKPVDLAALERLIVRFSYLIIEQSWIREIDINPLLVAHEMTASSEGLLALDARVVLQPADMQVPPRSAIRPYPQQYVQPWTFSDGTEILIRPIRPEDEPMIARFHERLSERSVYLRYFHLIDLDRRVSHDRLIRICFNDYDRDIALVAEHENAIHAVGRLKKIDATDAELAVLITDEYQGHGLGTELSRRLLDIARAEKMERVIAEILPENTHMQRVCRELGFRMEQLPDHGEVHAVYEISS